MIIINFILKQSEEYLKIMRRYSKKIILKKTFGNCSLKFYHKCYKIRNHHFKAMTETYFLI